jgi:hypothetical protein
MANIVEANFAEEDEEASIAYLEELQNYRKAMHSDKAVHWGNAMIEEMESIKKSQTWTLTKLPPNRTAIGSKWVYHLKYNVKGEIERYKA